MLTALTTALAFAKRLPPWVYYIIAAAIAAGLIYRAGWNARDEKADLERAEYVAEYEQAADRARRAQQAVNDAAQARYDQLAKEADYAHQTTRIVVRDATDSFIERNRVQDNQCVASAADSPASGDSAGLPAPVPSGVIVGEADVRACADLYAYAVNAREWALGLAGN